MTFDWPKTVLTTGFFISGVGFLFPGIMLLLGATMAVPASAIEVSASLVRDILEGSSDSDPEHLEAVNGTVFFEAYDGQTGRELWKSDGTEQGTVLVKDIKPGTALDDSSPGLLTNVNGTLFFVADDGIHGRELWKSDGTESGTVMVKDIRPGEFHSHPRKLTAVGDTLYFSATHVDYGRELWKSDGTETGTVLVKDIFAGGSRANSNPDWLTDVNGTLFFQADDGVHGIELWKSDGTESGTVLVKNIRTSFIGSDPQWLTNVNNTLFFVADDGEHVRELWKSDGTEQGTVLVKDIHETGGSFPVRLQNVAGLLMFSATDGVHGRELWASDGTETGTYLVKDINPGLDSSQPSKYGNLFSVFHMSNVAAGDRLFFRAYDGTTDTSLSSSGELWVSDGTEEGTFQVKDIHPGGESQPSWITAMGNNVFFKAEDGVHHNDLFFSDGTEEGTFLVDEFRTDGGASTPRYLTNVNGVLMLSASDGGIWAEPQGQGRELWKANIVEICDNDNGDCNTRVGLKVACWHEPLYPTIPGETVTITAEAIDQDGATVPTDVLEIWLNDSESAAIQVLGKESAELKFTADWEFFRYGCFGRRDVDPNVLPEDYFSGWRLVDVGDPLLPFLPAVPVGLHGPINEKIDIVFFPDQDDYTGPGDRDFHDDAGRLIREGMFTIPWFVEFQHIFNFWIANRSAVAGPDPDADDPSEDLCLREPPDRYKKSYSFADAGAFVHTKLCRDNAGRPGVFTIDLEAGRLQVFSHELGHRPFGLKDEYCCDGGYGRNNPFPNLYKTEAGCRNGASERGWNPDDCRGIDELRPFPKNRTWWIFEPDFSATGGSDLMQNTDRRRINASEFDRMTWMLGNCLKGDC